MSSAAEFLAAVETAESASDVLAAVHRALDIDGAPPTPEALGRWFSHCPDDVIEEVCTLADATGHSVPSGGEGDESVTLAVHLRGIQALAKIDDSGPRVSVATTLFREIGEPPRNPHALSARWLAMNPTDRPRFPLAPIVRAWADRPRAPSRRHLIVTTERRPPKEEDPFHLVRTPGLLHTATLVVVEVDDAPFAGQMFDGPSLRRWKTKPLQGNLFPGPRTLAGEAMAGSVVETVANQTLDGDERSPIRADLLRLGNLAYALTGSTRITDAEGAILVGGADTLANRRRFNRALGALRHLAVETRTGIRWDIADAERGPGVNRIGPPRWWMDYWRIANGLTGTTRRRALANAGFSSAPIAWRLTRGLWRTATKWGTVERTVAGIESTLLWGASAGAGHRGRTPDALIPAQKGGPGSASFITWWQLLRISGENVGPDADPKGSVGRRYRRRIADLRAAGYFTTPTATASAGDTVEILDQVRGGRGRPAGVIVRASARYCAAYMSGKRTRIHASRLLPKQPPA